MLLILKIAITIAAAIAAIICLVADEPNNPTT
jgi:hypothetical protein